MFLLHSFRRVITKSAAATSWTVRSHWANSSTLIPQSPRELHEMDENMSIWHSKVASRHLRSEAFSQHLRGSLVSKISTASSKDQTSQISAWQWNHKDAQYNVSVIIKKKKNHISSSSTIIIIWSLHLLLPYKSRGTIRTVNTYWSFSASFNYLSAFCMISCSLHRKHLLKKIVQHFNHPISIDFSS